MFVKFREESSWKFGKDPYCRTICELLEKGYVNCNKHPKITSHNFVNNVKKILGVERAGHSGTLDPQVTGVLIVGLGKATRLMECLLKSNKEYVCLMYIHKKVSCEKLEEVFGKFTGKIVQVPPVVSAVKRAERVRHIYDLTILETECDNQFVLFRVSCERGVYIRKLCSDMGEFLGVGAQMVELRRVRAGGFCEDEESHIGLDDLRNLYELYVEEEDLAVKGIFEKELRKYLRPMEEILRGYKKVIVRDSCVSSLTYGSDLAIPGVLKLDEHIEVGDEVAIFTQKGEIVCLGVSYLTSEQVMKKRKGAFIKTGKVFLEVGVYPNVWNFG